MAFEAGRARSTAERGPCPEAAALACNDAEWVSRATPPALAARQVHVWAAGLDVGDRILAELRASLSEREEYKARRFRFDVHRRRFIAARGLLRRLIGAYLDVAPRKVEFGYGPRGKPFLSNGEGAALGFNATDSGDQALFAFARNMELGIDVERVPRNIGHDEIARRHFAAAEIGALREFPEQDRQRAFLACWTRKEAYGKAEGVGIRYPLDSVCLCENLTVPDSTIRADNSLSGRSWSLRQFQPDFEGVATLVSSESDYDIRCFRLHPDR